MTTLVRKVRARTAEVSCGAGNGRDDCNGSAASLRSSGGRRPRVAYRSMRIAISASNPPRGRQPETLRPLLWLEVGDKIHRCDGTCAPSVCVAVQGGAFMPVRPGQCPPAYCERLRMAQIARPRLTASRRRRLVRIAVAFGLPLNEPMPAARGIIRPGDSEFGVSEQC